MGIDAKEWCYDEEEEGRPKKEKKKLSNRNESLTPLEIIGW